MREAVGKDRLNSDEAVKAKWLGATTALAEADFADHNLALGSGAIAEGSNDSGDL